MQQQQQQHHHQQHHHQQQQQHRLQQQQQQQAGARSRKAPRAGGPEEHHPEAARDGEAAMTEAGGAARCTRTAAHRFSGKHTCRVPAHQARWRSWQRGHVLQAGLVDGRDFPDGPLA